jgi:hypothetical protein
LCAEVSRRLTLLTLCVTVIRLVPSTLAELRAGGWLSFCRVEDGREY